MEAHVGEFIRDLADAVDVYIDSLSRGGIRLGGRFLRAVAHVDAEVRQEQREQFYDELRQGFDELFPSSQLNITIDHISRSVRTKMEAAWGEIGADWNDNAAAGRLDPAVLIRGVTEQLAKIAAAMAANVAALVALLLIPGGFLADLGFTFIASGVGRRQVKNLPDRVAQAKREARVRVRGQRRELVHRLTKQFTNINQNISNGLIDTAKTTTRTQRATHTDLLKLLADWEASRADLVVLIESGDDLGVSRTEKSVPDLIAEFADISTALDLDYATEVTTLRDFWAGPRVVLVTGPPRTDRTRLTAALTGAVPSATVAETEIAGVADRYRDVLVLATPADKLLPIEQQDLLKTTAPDGGPILVAVTGLHRLGDERTQAATRTELEQLRLRLLLTPLGMRWWFTEPDDTSNDLRAEVARQCAVEEVHGRQVRTALKSLADGAIARCRPRVEERERHLELLHRLRHQLGPAGSDAHDQVRTQALTARDVMSEMFERFYEEVGPARDRALAWLANDRITPWDDVVHPLQQSWSTLVAQIGQTPGRQASALHGELERIVRAESQLGAQLGVTVEPLTFTDRTWADPASAEALGRLADVDLAPDLERFRQNMTPKKDQDEDETLDEGRPPNLVNHFVRRVGTEIDDRLRKPDPEQLATQFDAGLRTLIRPRSATVVDTIQRLVETEGNSDATAVGAWLEATAKVVADEVAERHRWYDVYLELVAFRDRL